MYKLDTTPLQGRGRYENEGACSLQPPPPPQTNCHSGSLSLCITEEAASSLSPVMLSQTLFSPLGHARWHSTICTADLRSAVHRGVKIVLFAGPLLTCVSDDPILMNSLPQVTIRPCSGPVLLIPGGELCDGSRSRPRSMLLPRCLALSLVRMEH